MFTQKDTNVVKKEKERGERMGWLTRERERERERGERLEGRRRVKHEHTSLVSGHPIL